MAELLIVFQRGAADALSILVPRDDPAYAAARPTLAVAPSATLPLGEGDWGLHPRATGLHSLWKAGRLGLVPACGPSTGTRSHFSAQFLAERAEPGAGATGWVGRYLATSRGSDSPFRAVAVGGFGVPMTLRGGAGSLGVRSLDDLGLGAFRPRQKGRVRTTPATPTPAALRALWSDAPGPVGPAALTGLQVLDDTGSVPPSPPTDAFTPTGAGPAVTDDETAAAFAEGVRLFEADLGTEVVMVNTGGWDTHAGQGEGGGGAVGGLIAGLDAGVAGFCSARPDATVVILTEFGRRVAENASAGTDHGRGSLMIVAGAGAAPGIHGDWPGLVDLDEGDVKAVNSMEGVLAEIAVRVLGADDPAAVVPGTRPSSFLGVCR